MATELFIPKLGQTVEQVTLVKWIAEDGVKVDFGDEILDVETDKAVFPVEANGKGFLHRGPFEEGQVLPVLTVVALIGSAEDRFALTGVAPAEAIPEAPATTEAHHAETKEIPSPKVTWAEGKLHASPRARKLATLENVDLRQVVPTGWGGMRIAERDVVSFLQQQRETQAAARITPVAQRMATIEGIDIARVSGSGPGGKIVKEDIERIVKPALETLKAMPVVVPASTKSPAQPVEEVIERIPLKGVRGLIAERMGASVHTTARVTLMLEADATELVAARSRIKTKVEEEWSFAPGYNDILAKIVCQALRKFPYMNARITTDAIERLGHINLGMAVDTERGLLVPVIRDADQKSLRQFGGEFREMVNRARAGRALPDDLAGGTFTITNLGMYDIEAFTPVINLPEAAIIGVGKIIQKPVIFNDNIVARHMLTLSLAFDHRVVDGAPAAKFLQYIKQLVEEPYLLLAGF